MVDIKDIYSGILTSLHREAPHKTMARKLIINVAPTGSFTSREQNPGQPYTMEENVQAAVEAYKAGAAVWHVHAREKNGLPSKDPYVVKETIARVLDKCPDMVTSVIPYDNYEAQGADLIKRTVKSAAPGGVPDATGVERRMGCLVSVTSQTRTAGADHPETAYS